MELASSYIPDEYSPFFWVGYYKCCRFSSHIDREVLSHQYGGWNLRHINLDSGVHLPLLHCTDYRIKFETLCFTLQYSDGPYDDYLSRFLEIYAAFEISLKVASKEALIALQYTPEALAWLTEYFGLKIADIPPEAPEGFSHKPLIFFLFTNSD